METPQNVARNITRTSAALEAGRIEEASRLLDLAETGADKLGFVPATLSAALETVADLVSAFMDARHLARSEFTPGQL